MKVQALINDVFIKSMALNDNCKDTGDPGAPVGVVITRRECQLGDMDVFSICFVIAALISNK